MQTDRGGTGSRRTTGRLTCPFCNSYDVTRMFIATAGVDSCECASCGSRWDEDRGDGRYVGRSDKASGLVHRRTSR